MNFSEFFLAEIDRLEGSARMAGETLTSLCRRAGVSRETPERWRRKLPSTIERMERLNAALTNIIAEKKTAKPVTRRKFKR